MSKVWFAEFTGMDGEEFPQKFLSDMTLRELSNSYGNGHLPAGVFGPYATEAEAEAAHPGAPVWAVDESRLDELMDGQGRYLSAQ